MHFMNPPPIMKLVEIIRGADTSDSTYNVTKGLAERYFKYNWKIYFIDLSSCFHSTIQVNDCGLASSESQSQGGKSGSGGAGWLMEIALQNKEKKCIL